jgi:transposase
MSGKKTFCFFPFNEMTRLKNFIGIDISKHWLDVAVIRSSNNKVSYINKCDNTIEALKKLKTDLDIHKIPLNKSTLVVCEHTGIYKKNLVDFLFRQKCLVCIEGSERIKKSLGIQRGKSDQIDAKRIAEYAIRNQDIICISKPPRKVIVRLKDLLINRERLTKAVNMLEIPLREGKNFNTKIYLKYFQDLNKKALTALMLAIRNINREINAICKNDKQITQQLNLLKSVPGLGLVTSLFLICYTHEFSLCNNGKQLACYVGVAPFPHSSGSSVKGQARISHIANKRLKALLHTGALACIRKRGAFHKYYQRRKAEGKKGLVILNAIRNKIILRAAAVIKRGTPYIKESDYMKKAVSARLA